MTSLAWIVPAVETAVDHRAEIVGITKRIWDRLTRKKTTIAITGIEAVGKTVLCDHLTGAAYDPSYKPPGKSLRMERSVATAPGTKMVLHVIPGQPSLPRNVALTELFNDTPVEGVIHVVSGGFVAIRNAVAAEILKTSGVTTIAALRANQLEKETQDLADVCARIRQAHQKSHQPKWMLVAVTKADLFHNEIAAVEQLYSEYSNSEFSRHINALQRQVGSDFFEWASHPVCAWLEDFEWNGEKILTSLKTSQRDAMLLKFLRYMEARCA